MLFIESIAIKSSLISLITQWWAAGLASDPAAYYIPNKYWGIINKGNLLFPVALYFGASIMFVTARLCWSKSPSVCLHASYRSSCCSGSAGFFHILPGCSNEVHTATQRIYPENLSSFHLCVCLCVCMWECVQACVCVCLWDARKLQ